VIRSATPRFVPCALATGPRQPSCCVASWRLVVYEFDHFVVGGLATVLALDRLLGEAQVVSSALLVASFTVWSSGHAVDPFMNVSYVVMARAPVPAHHKAAGGYPPPHLGTDHRA
jgi:hypothetical protein